MYILGDKIAQHIGANSAHAECTACRNIILRSSRLRRFRAMRQRIGSDASEHLHFKIDNLLNSSSLPFVALFCSCVASVLSCEHCPSGSRGPRFQEHLEDVASSFHGYTRI
jgi:hypothetical protein